MSAITVLPPYPVFTSASGAALEAGYIYIGTAGLNAQTSPISVYWDSALTIPAAQPIRTTNGYPSRNGSPAMIYVAGDYSIIVRDKRESLVYSALNATARYSGVIIGDVYFLQSGANAQPTTVQNKLTEFVSVKDFGAIGNGLTDDRIAFVNALATGKPVYVPAGDYLISSAVPIPSNSTIFGYGRASRLYTSLSSPVNIFTCAAGATNITLRGLHFDGRRKSGSIVIPGSRGRGNALILFGSTGAWTTNLQVLDCFFTEAIHFHLAFESCDGVTVRNVVVNGNGLNAGGTSPLGNVDGVHFTNCRNASIDVGDINSGDDMVGFTTDVNALGASYVLRATNIRGSSNEANGVIVNGEAGSTTAIYDVQISKIRFTCSGSPIQGTAVRAKQIATEAISQVHVADVIARSCGAALDFTSVTDCHATDVHGNSTTDHAIRIVSTTDCSIGEHSTRNAGSNTGSWDGLFAQGNTRLAVRGAGNHYRADRWGVSLQSNTDSSFDGLVSIGSGRRTVIGAERGGFLLSGNTDCIFGPNLKAKDDGSSFTNYGLRTTTDTRGQILAAPENFAGVTNGINNAAGVATLPGAPIAWAVITDTGAAATLVASRNITGITRNAQGSYDLTYNGQIFRPSDAVQFVLSGSASDGATNNDLVVKASAYNLASCQVRVTNGANALGAMTTLTVQIFGTYYLR